MVGDGKLKGRSFKIPSRKVSPQPVTRNRKSIIRAVKGIKIPKAEVKDRDQTTPIKRKIVKSKVGNLYDQLVKFFGGYTSSHLIRKKFGNQRIVQELQRNTQDNETYGGFFGKQENWIIHAVPEMNLLNPVKKEFVYEPECLLGVGGQGCVFLGKFINDDVGKSYAFKIRQRSKTATNPASPSRRKSPNFRLVNGRIKEEAEDGIDSGSSNDDVNFIDDVQQEALHREAVAAFRVYATSQMEPKPVLYGYSHKQDFEVFVMDIMDFTLNDFIKGTSWKIRMDNLSEVWAMIKDSFDNCHQANVVHYDIKPENLGIRITNGKLEYGLLDFGISKTNGYLLDRYCKTKIYRPPGTVSYMSPRSHIWKPISWMDDFLCSFFTMYNYSITEGKSSYDKLENVKQYRKNSLTLEDKKTLTPNSLAVYCIKHPPWSRFPYGNLNPIKKKQNESIVKEEISLAMIKIHCMSNPTNLNDIISIILNIDGYLDDTMDIQELTDEAQRADYSSKTAQAVHSIFTKQLGKFTAWWIEYAAEVRKIIDDYWENTSQNSRDKNFAFVNNLISQHIPNRGDIEALVENSTNGKKLLEANF